MNFTQQELKPSKVKLLTYSRESLSNGCTGNIRKNITFVSGLAHLCLAETGWQRLDWIGDQSIQYMERHYCSNCVLETRCLTNNNVLSKILIFDHVYVLIFVCQAQLF